MLNAKSFKAMGFETLSDLEAFLDREDVKTLIGDKYDHYRELWLETFDRKVNKAEKVKIKGRFNWLALLSYIIWAAYRKMYAHYLAFLFLMAALTFAEVYFGFEVPSGAFVGMFIALALMSKDFYFGNLVEYVKKLDAMDEGERESYIALRAGTSKLYAWLALPVFLAVLIGSAIVASVISTGVAVPGP